MNVLVSGGGTVAPIDDVRVVTNSSSGRFSAAISEACLRRGATVWHVHTPTAELPFLRSARADLDAEGPAAEADAARLEALRCEWQAVRDRLRLVGLRPGTVGHYAATLERIFRAEPIDVAFLAIAASDYEPEPVAGKISSDRDDLVIRCRKAPKVIRSVKEWAPDVYLVGFKLLSGVSTAELLRRASQACRANRADATVANDLTTLRAGQHTVHLVREGHATETFPPGLDLADRLVARVFGLVGDRPRAGG